VILKGPNRNKIVHRGTNRKLGVRLIFAPVVHKLLKQGCKGYLCNVINYTAIKPSIKSILVVCGFPDVFLEEIPTRPHLGK